MPATRSIVGFRAFVGCLGSPAVLPTNHLEAAAVVSAAVLLAPPRHLIRQEDLNTWITYLRGAKGGWEAELFCGPVSPR
jgi:hypothetical protein